MPIPKLTPNEYQEYINISERKHVLVEGKTDKRFVSLLFDEFDLSVNGNSLEGIDIDTAQDIIDFKGDIAEDIVANWEKIEKMVELISNKEYAYRFVGLVDRELRGFSCQEKYIDHLDQHKISNRLIWTRGHSIENYLFNETILRDSFRGISNFENFPRILNCFTSVLEESIRVACALSLAARSVEKLDVIRKSIEWDFISITPKVKIEFDSWKKQIVERQSNRISEIEVDKIITNFYTEISFIDNSDLQVVKWLCDGHLGFRFISTVFCRCIFEVLSFEDMKKAHNQVNNFRRLSDEGLCHLSASSWVKKALLNQCEYPKEIFKLLDLIIT